MTWSRRYEYTFEHDGRTRTIVIDYDHTNHDTYIVEFSGELLRDETIAWQELAAALRGMAQA